MASAYTVCTAVDVLLLLFFVLHHVVSYHVYEQVLLFAVGIRTYKFYSSSTAAAVRKKVSSREKGTTAPSSRSKKANGKGIKRKRWLIILQSSIRNVLIGSRYSVRV